MARESTIKLANGTYRMRTASVGSLVVQAVLDQRSLYATTGRAFRIRTHPASSTGSRPGARTQWPSVAGGTTWLGLALVADVAAMHGGQVRAHNREDGQQGAVLVAELPVPRR
ncbi:MAG: hypothetical protein M3130_06495 [Actinomycetota bacterium]|nr:hypothetical protein [Actinomycetota bacterium]